MNEEETVHVLQDIDSFFFFHPMIELCKSDK